jgi:hypothetical protein
LPGSRMQRCSAIDRPAGARLIIICNEIHEEPFLFS